jgi:putative nucleotidyltransferase with HDIG domain
MPSPGEVMSGAPARAPVPRADGATVRPADLLQEGRTRERAGCLPEAAELYAAAIEAAVRAGDHRVRAEACRRLGVVRHHRNDTPAARELCQKSYEVSLAAGEDLLAAEALNALGVIALQTGALDAARETFGRAFALGSSSLEIRARVEQNLGILANIRGDFDAALEHYRGSLDAYERSGDEHGQAIAYHNLGMVSADRGLWEAAHDYFTRTITIAQASGDVRLQGICQLNHAEVHLARQRFEEARHNAEAALLVFDQLEDRAAKADAYRVIGMVYRETGKMALAESRLRAAIEHSAATGSVLGEAEATRELALLYQALGRNQQALTFLNNAYRLFGRLDARVDLIYVGGKVADLQQAYLAVVKEWGQSIESSDSYTHGHCERVAEYAVAVARGLGLSDDEITTIRIGAYLHDLGKVKVPHEILNKPGPLSREEMDIMRMHPVWGIEMLATVEFPWDIKPIIRWHHEKSDGTGYPDRLRGDEIPLSAQIIGISDVFDALTTTRAYRPAMTHEVALREMQKMSRCWKAEVHAAFMRTVGQGLELPAAA